MRLIPRHRHHHRPRPPRVPISQVEITADLLYPASPRALREEAPARGRRSGR
jgi:hypothetical protein